MARDVRTFAKDIAFDFIVKTAYHVLKEGDLVKTETPGLKPKEGRNKHSVLLPSSYRRN